MIKFDKNACVLVNQKGLPIGTRVLGFVTHELRARQMMKVGRARWPLLHCPSLWEALQRQQLGLVTHELRARQMVKVGWMRARLMWSKG